jgi:predicted ATPase
MSALDSIKVKGYKSILNLDMQLNNLNVLIGANGSGKSNFISVFKLLNQVVERNLQLYVAQAGGADTLLSFGRKLTDVISINLKFGSNKYSVQFMPSANDTLIFGDEYCSHTYPTGYTYDVPLATGTRETGLVEEAMARRGDIAPQVLNSMRSWKIYHFHDTSESAKVKQTGDLNDNRVLRPDASNLAAFLFGLQLRNPDYFTRIVQIIRLMIPFFDDFNLHPSTLNENKIRLEWREKGSDAYFDANALSDGTLRFMCLATLLLQPQLPSTILIDEPELGLHPYAITLLAGLLRSASVRTQVIVSTQSVSLVNQFSPEDIIVVDKHTETGGSSFRRLEREEIEDWLQEYSLGELWEKNVLGGRP